MRTKIVLTVFILLALTGSSLAMPMQVCTPEQIADILLQPTNNEIANLKLDLVSGDITVEEWRLSMAGIKFRLGMQLVLLEAIRDCGKTFEEKINLLLAVFPWNVRSTGNMPRIIGGAHL